MRTGSRWGRPVSVSRRGRSRKSCWSPPWEAEGGSFPAVKLSPSRPTTHPSPPFEKREKKEESEVRKAVRSIVPYLKCVNVKGPSADIWESLKTRKKATELGSSCCTWRSSTPRRSGRSLRERGGGSPCRTPRRCWRPTSPIMSSTSRQWSRLRQRLEGLARSDSIPRLLSVISFHILRGPAAAFITVVNYQRPLAECPDSETLFYYSPVQCLYITVSDLINVIVPM